MNTKLIVRLKRKKKLRTKIKNLGLYRLSINRTSKHIYAQIFVNDGESVLLVLS